MRYLAVVESPGKIDREITGVELISPRDYLMRTEFGALRSIRVINLCKSLSYQSLGYYVSLLAAARGHKPLPSISTLLDMKNVSLVRFVSDDLDELIQRSLRTIQGPAFALSIYFGKNLARRHDRLARALFNVFPAPFFRANFKLEENWRLTSIKTLSFGGIRDDHLDFALQRVSDYCEHRIPKATPRKAPRYSLAILYNPDDPTSPSDLKAVEKFKAAAEDKGISSDIIDKSDYGRLAEYDALFIRETTGVNHYTYRFARKGQAENLVVIDDADSILKCTNKVFLAELFQRNSLRAPRTMVIHARNRDEVIGELGLPLILKQPDSSFSLGVVKVENQDEYHLRTTELLKDSDLLIAQEFLPTPFDWRIGVLGRTALFACKYFMARHHWQIARRTAGGNTYFGKVEVVPLADAPIGIISTAVRAAGLIGTGLYGVDMKDINGQPVIIEVNENPNIDSGVEDQLLKDGLYSAIIDHFLVRLEARTNGVR